MLFDVNYLSVIVVAIINIILGMLYYSPKVLGNEWGKAMNVSMDQSPGKEEWIGMIVVSLLTVWTLAVILNVANALSIVDGIVIGLVAWILVAAQHYSAVIWNKKPIKAYFIDAGWQLLSFLVISIILTAWR